MEIFSKGFVSGFGEKLAILPCFHFWRYRPEKCLLQYSRTKNAFLGYKNKKFKISKNWGFSKWVSLCFVQKLATSPSFFIFGNIGQEKKFFLRYSGSKKRCFLDFVKLYFCRLHCTFFYSENQIKIFSGLICPKSHLKNKIPFFDKKRGLILLESFIFWTFLKVFLSCLKTTLFY